MQTGFKESFSRDLKKIKDKKLLKRISGLIKEVEKVNSLLGIKSLRKLKTGRNYYRIRIGDYRIGIIVKAKTIIFVRALHRKELYRYFPQYH